MGLTDFQIRKAKPAEKPYRLPDGRGLYLQVNANGGKWWRFRYKFEGKEKMISLGEYPEVSLRDARDDHHEKRKLVRKGVNPSELRRAEKIVNKSKAETFETVAREWFTLKHCKEVSEGHAATTLKRLENYVFDFIGKVPINEVSPPVLLSVLRRVENKGALETAHRIKSICGQIFRYAVATGQAERDPASDLRGILPAANKKHLAAITEPTKVAELMKAIDSYRGGLVTRAALQFAPLVFVRPGELRHAEWSEIDLVDQEWNIPAGKMKMKQAHLVPLSRQAVDVLKEIQPVTGSGRYVFPGARSAQRPMSENAINAALRSMGFEKHIMTGHGFRAMARTILDEILQVRPELIEHQLAHTVKDALGRAYNRTQHLEERKKMMQTWADYLDGLKAGAKVIPIKNHKTA